MAPSALDAALEPFADRVVRTVRRLGHPLCLGLDPHPERIPRAFRKGAMEPSDPETARAVEGFCIAALDRAAGRVAAVKPQIAFFERLGAPGIEALEAVVAAARERGLLVVLDAKRGDVPSTAHAYAEAWLAPGARARADALTVSPYLGVDALEPFVAQAEASGAGLFTLVRTSNPGATLLQDLVADGRPLWAHVAAALAPLAERLAGPASGYSGVGAVAGATRPEVHRELRALLPTGLFLVPGFGAQGGGARDAVAGFVPGPEGRLEGGLVVAARSVLFPEGAERADARGWERAVEAALGEAAEALSRAVESPPSGGGGR